MSDQAKGEHDQALEARRQRLRERLGELDSATVPDELLNLARAVAGVEDPEMTCEDCQAWLPSYVDAEVGGMPAGEEYPAVHRHLNLCADCEAVYLEMLDLALAEEAGELPIPEHFPQPDLGFLPAPALPVVVQAWTEAVVDAVAPRLSDELQVIADVFFERVRALGDQFRLKPSLAPTLGFGGGETTEALQMLAATYATTQAIVTDLSPAEIEEQAQAGQLAETLRRQAEQAAHDLNLDPEQAQTFAEEYAELVSRDPGMLRELSVSEQ